MGGDERKGGNGEVSSPEISPSATSHESERVLSAKASDHGWASGQSSSGWLAQEVHGPAAEQPSHGEGLNPPSPNKPYGYHIGDLFPKEGGWGGGQGDQQLDLHQERWQQEVDHHQQQENRQGRSGSKNRALDGKTSTRREGAQLSNSSIKLVFSKSELVKRSQKVIVKQLQ
ncbi:hypothetical protein E2562_009399 [Oryza meyeriana var. granulata]|uniref:Uncharacterized protein n=1 Tax=Oryza meyeriana var. granulata TaxID=110450 RepID=A0A6G1BSZ8_9ORYZ|nr:hypothetical protein E2562_009399 [Oryza meyeriana var. granulata]